MLGIIFNFHKYLPIFLSPVLEKVYLWQVKKMLPNTLTLKAKRLN